MPLIQLSFPMLMSLPKVDPIITVAHRGRGGRGNGRHNPSSALGILGLSLQQVAALPTCQVCGKVGHIALG